MTRITENNRRITENNRKEILKDIREGYIDLWGNLMINKLINEIEKEHEEVKQYRKIGTVEECRNYKHIFHMAEVALKHIEKEEVENKVLGGIEEFKALKDAEEQGLL